MIRDTDISFAGSSTLDSGLTVGFQIDATADGGDGFFVKKSFAHFSGNWGRVNLGAEDGAAFLLQVAAPAADSVIDGVRQDLRPVNYNVAPAGFAGINNISFDYANDITGETTDKVTYFTPVFNGFQAGVSYTFDHQDNGGSAQSFGVRQNNEDERGSAWELAARYEAQFNAVKIALGGGYSTVDRERAIATTDDHDAWNAGLVLGFGGVQLGGAYLKEENYQGTKNSDIRTWVLGADYTTGPFVLGASYYDSEFEQAGALDLDTKRYSAGVTYGFAPGMSLRGSIHHVEHDQGATNMDATSFLWGTHINF